MHKRFVLRMLAIVILMGLLNVCWAHEAVSRTILFAGREWTVRTGDGGPGPNHWSDSEQSVWVDDKGLHLKIRKIDNVWHCAEITSVLPTRYGMHRFYITGRADQLDKNVVASPFLYKDDTHEVDIEFSYWQKEKGNNAQYVIQPFLSTGNIHRFALTLPEPESTHYFDWTAESIHFKSFNGYAKEPSDAYALLQKWTYTGKNNPLQSEPMHIHINCWLINGKAPANGQEAEFIVKDADLPEPLP